MKNKNKKHAKPFHLHVEHFFRQQLVIYAVLALVGVGLLKADNKTMLAARHAYIEGAGAVGEFMREETTRMPVMVNLARITTNSGR